MIIGILPTVDYAFKHLFGRDSTRPILIDVLGAVLNRPAGHSIEEIELQNPFNPKEALDDKLSILDIKARDQTGRQFNVEMQMLPFRHYQKRIVYYWSRLHQQQLREGENYLTLMPTISISFLDHILCPQISNHHLEFKLLEVSHHIPLTEDIEFHTLELPKFTKSAEELETELDVWLYFLRHAATMDTDALPTKLRKPLVVRALEELKMLSQTDQERERYEARRKWQLDYNTAMAEARLQGRDEGRAEGKIGTIHFCEQLLHRPETPSEQLANMSVDELSRLADDLQQQLLNQR